MISRRHLLPAGPGSRHSGLGCLAARSARSLRAPGQRGVLVVSSHCHGWPYATWKMPSDPACPARSPGRST